MILIGQFDSPFVRRVAIALELYGQRYEHLPWSTFGDGDKIAPFNPLRRVPTLVLDDGQVLIESAYILDYLDERAGADKALIAASGPARQKALYLIALATGLADKAVILFYEKALHEQTSELWLTRCRTQIAAVLDRLETERADMTTPWLADGNPGHVDIALACALRFVSEAHADSVSLSQWPALLAHSVACEAMPVFGRIQQPFAPPGK